MSNNKTSYDKTTEKLVFFVNKRFNLINEFQDKIDKIATNSLEDVKKSFNLVSHASLLGMLDRQEQNLEKACTTMLTKLKASKEEKLSGYLESPSGRFDHGKLLDNSRKIKRTEFKLKYSPRVPKKKMTQFGKPGEAFEVDEEFIDDSDGSDVETQNTNEPTMISLPPEHRDHLSTMMKEQELTNPEILKLREKEAPGKKVIMEHFLADYNLTMDVNDQELMITACKDVDALTDYIKKYFL